MDIVTTCFTSVQESSTGPGSAASSTRYLSRLELWTYNKLSAMTLWCLCLFTWHIQDIWRQSSAEFISYLPTLLLCLTYIPVHCSPLLWVINQGFTYCSKLLQAWISHLMQAWIRNFLTLFYAGTIEVDRFIPFIPMYMSGAVIKNMKLIKCLFWNTFKIFLFGYFILEW